MDTLKLIITILQLLCGLAIIVVVLCQSGKSAGLSGSIGGVADSFLARNKAKTMDAKLAQGYQMGGRSVPDPDSAAVDSGITTCDQMRGMQKHPPHFYSSALR